MIYPAANQVLREPANRCAERASYRAPALLEIATRAVCEEMGLHPDRWESFAHLSQTAFKAIAEHLPEDVRALFAGGGGGVAADAES